MQRRSKYKAVPTVVDGIRFASKREAARYMELVLLQRSGQVKGLRLQPRMKIAADGRPVLLRSKGYPNGRALTYVADFAYIARAPSGEWEINETLEDVKGMDTTVSRIKRALIESIYQTTILITR